MSRPQTITDEQIAEAARRTFVEEGPGAPVSRVAERLGVSQAALFHRVGSKAELLLRGLTPGAPDVLRRLASPPTTDRPIDAQLAAILRETLAFLDRAVPGIIVLKSAGLQPGSPMPGPAPTLLLRRALARWLVRARVAGPSPGVLAEALLGAIEARAFNRAVGGPATVAGTDPRFIARLVRGLLPRARSRPIRHSAARTTTRAKPST